MVVVLKPDAVAKQLTRADETVAKLFPDQRVYANPRLWGAVSLKSASLVRELETRFSTRAFLAWGHKTHGFAAMLNTQQVEALRADPNVQEVFEDLPGKLAGAASAPWSDAPVPQNSTATTGSPTIYTRGWNLKAINLYNSNPTTDSPAYRTDGGYPVKTYIIDTGIQPHADLNYNAQVDHISFDCHDNVGGNCTATASVPTEPNQVYTVQCDSHGTYVAGVVGANRESVPVGVEGVAPGASLVSVRVINYCSANVGQLAGTAYTSGVIAAINWMIKQVPNNGVDSAGRRRLSAVANMSIVWDKNITSQIVPAGLVALNKAITDAVKEGIFFSFAAGNSNQPACEIYPGALGTSINGAMSVGAIQANGGAMDNRVGGAGDKVATYGACVEIWAPGRDVHGAHARTAAIEQNAWGYVVPLNNYALGQHYYAPVTGSSLAAPHVAGAALLLARKYQLAGQPLPAPADLEIIIKSKRKFLGYWDPFGTVTNEVDRRINALTVDDL